MQAAAGGHPITFNRNFMSEGHGSLPRPFLLQTQEGVYDDEI